MKIQIGREKIELEETSATFPIYSIVEEEDSTCYVKLDEDQFTQIITNNISIEIMQWKRDNKVIPAIWWDNQCEKEEWEKQLKHTQEFLQSF